MSKRTVFLLNDKNYSDRSLTDLIVLASCLVVKGGKSAGVNLACILSVRRCRMKVSLVLTVGASIGGLLFGSGCAKPTFATSRTSPKPIYHNSVTTPPDLTIITEAPPPPQIEVVGDTPGSDYTWIPGHWEWEGQWVWAEGKWVKAPRPEAMWVPGRWIHRMHGWVWIRGYWRYSIS